MNTIIALASPVTNQMEHTSDLTWLYWLLLPAFLIVFGISALAKRSKASHEYKNRSPLAVEQDRLTEWRRIVSTTGLSPVAGKSAQEAIEEQEALCRSLWALQSGLHSGTPEGGRSNDSNPNGR